jgi:hypothetical protein
MIQCCQTYKPSTGKASKKSRSYLSTKYSCAKNQVFGVDISVKQVHFSSEENQRP